jgi:Domain of unknown function (DUF4785) N-terminal domain/Domain of unknown function (DUF4785) C-terminal domain
MSHQLRAFVLTVLLLASLCGAASAASEARWLAAADGDLVADTLTAPLGLKAASVPREAVAFSWALDADKALDLGAAASTAESKEYWVEVSAADLGRGVPIFTTAPGALVRLNPVPGAKAMAPIDPAGLVLSDPAGKVWSAGSGMDLAVGADKLRAAGAPFVEGTAAFRLRADLGAGTFGLRADGLAGDGRYVLLVLDRASSVALRLTSLAADHLHGQELRLEAALTDAGAPVAKAGLDGYVTSPAGRAWPLTFERLDGGTYGAKLTLDGLEAPAPGLWEAHVAAHSPRQGGAVMRSARVPFQVAVPSARFDGGLALTAGDGLAVRLGVEAAAASRYEVRAILYGSGDSGELLPAAVGHSAAWLEPGHGALELRFDRAVVEASGLHAPYEIRDLRLVDQGTMGLLHRQARGLVLGE